MVIYVKYKRVQTQNSVLEFRATDDAVEVHHFDGKVVSLISENQDAIGDLIATQAKEIECTEIDYDTFKEIVKDSDQIKRINTQVKAMIAKKYDFADEIAMSKKAVDDEKKIAYEEYVSQCIAYGDKLKEAIGY